MTTENQLAVRARLGDKAAFTDLVTTYQTPVYNLCYRMLGEAREAEDAAQETFLRAYRQLHSYDPGRPFKTWLFAIANNHCIDRLRRRRLVWLSIDDEPVLQHPALRETAHDPEEIAGRNERSAEIQSMLDRLAPDSRSAILLHYWYGLSYQEIADTLHTSVSAVKSRLHRARLELGTIMAGSEKSSPRPRCDFRAALAAGQA